MENKGADGACLGNSPGCGLQQAAMGAVPYSWRPSTSQQGAPLVTKAPWIRAAAAAKSLQSCPTLCDPIDSSPPGSPVPGILQARTLEWVAISFSNA